MKWKFKKMNKSIKVTGWIFFSSEYRKRWIFWITITHCILTYLGFYFLFVFFFFVNLTMLKLFEKRNLNLKKERLPLYCLWASVRGIFLIRDWCGRAQIIVGIGGSMSLWSRVLRSFSQSLRRVTVNQLSAASESWYRLLWMTPPLLPF